MVGESSRPLCCSLIPEALLCSTVLLRKTLGPRVPAMLCPHTHPPEPGTQRRSVSLCTGGWPLVPPASEPSQGGAGTHSLAARELRGHMVCLLCQAQPISAPGPGSNCDWQQGRQEIVWAGVLGWQANQAGYVEASRILLGLTVYEQRRAREDEEWGEGTCQRRHERWRESKYERETAEDTPASELERETQRRRWSQ